MDKNVSFIRKGNDSSGAFRPDDDKELSKGEERIQQKLYMGRMIAGNFFPEPLPMSLMRSSHKSDKVSIMSKVSDLDALGQNLPFVTCVAQSPTICFAIERVGLIRTAPEMLDRLMREAIYLVTIPQMQQKWIIAKEWTLYKSNLVNHILEQNAQIKANSKQQNATEMNKKHV